MCETKKGENIGRPSKWGWLRAGTCSAETQQTRSEWRASSSQMKADRWLFPGPGISHEVSMFIMMILIILLTCPFFFFFFGIWCGTPAFQAGVNHSSRQSCVSTLQLFFLTGLMLNHAWVILILSENCSLVEETLFYTFLLCCKCVKMVFRCSLGTSVSVGKFPQQVWVWKNENESLSSHC